MQNKETRSPLSAMKRLQAWKYKLRPNGLQKRLMRLFCRVVFNKALALQEEQRKHREKKSGYAELCKLLTAWRHAPETLWLAEAPTHPLQQALKDLERAWTNCYCGAGRRTALQKTQTRRQLPLPGCQTDSSG